MVKKANTSMILGYIAMFIIVASATLSMLLLCVLIPMNASKVTSKTIVLDAGHGGQDGGAVSPKGIKESDINLSICLQLEKTLKENGYTVIMTRKTTDALADGANFKKEDMRKRKEIITKSQADLVLSVHLNKFGMPSRRGAQVFVTKTEKSKLLGKCLQDSLNSNINKIYSGRNFSSLVGDYFILNCSSYPSAIAECGFLSNSEDERLLQTSEYQAEIVKSLYTGILNYFSTPLSA